MSKKITCPACHQIFDLNEAYLGRRIQCPACTHFFIAEDKSETKAPEPVNNTTPAEPEKAAPAAGSEKAAAAAGAEKAAPAAGSEKAAAAAGSEKAAPAESKASSDDRKQDNNTVSHAQNKAQTSNDKGIHREKDDNGLLKGKIGAKSVNIYDDMADAAFDYLFSAAQKIINEEDDIQVKIDQATEEIEQDKKKISSEKTKAIICFVLTGAALLLVLLPDARILGAAAVIPLVIALIAFFAIKKNEEKMNTDLGTLEGFKKDFANIKRDYKINKLGVAYVPVATQVPFEGKSFLLDDTKHVGKKEFSMYQMNHHLDFVSTVNKLKQLKETLPLIEKNENCEDIQTSKVSSSVESIKFYDFIGETDRNMREAVYLLNDLNKTSVSLPIIDPKGKLAQFLDEFCTDSVGHQPVLSVFPSQAYQKELEQFNEMNELRKTMAKENEKFEQMLRDFIKSIAEFVQMTGNLKMMSTNKIVDYSNSMLFSAFRASCNHYSAALEAEEIKRLHEEEFNYQNNADAYEPFTLHSASLVKFDPISNNWVGEDGSRTNHPFGIHQIQEEVIAPLVRNLLCENRVERLNVYNNIRDQKLDYLNQWHRDTDDFYGRGRQESSDIINIMQTTLTEFNTALSQYKSFEETEKNLMQSQNLKDSVVQSKGSTMAFSIAYCEEQTKNIRIQQDEFNNYIERIKEDIDRRAEEFNYTRFYDAYLQDGRNRQYVQALFNADSLSNRQKNLLEAGEFIADNIKLPPEPDVSETIFDCLGKDLNDEVNNVLAELDKEHSVTFSDETDDSQNKEPDKKKDTVGKEKQASNGPSPQQTNSSDQSFSVAPMKGYDVKSEEHVSSDSDSDE